jgi:1,4-dihydroxy-2-naphthoate octaprenyltransferase
MHGLRWMAGPMRVPFLIVTPACVAVGVGTAYWQTGQVAWLQVLLVLIGAVASHICVNVFNEYFDFRSGLDAKTNPTPFSGGSGILPRNPELARPTLLLALSAMGVVALVGLYFVWQRGWQLLPLGILGMFLLVAYTIWLAYEPILCLVAPGLGFGVFMVMGTHFALTGTYTWTAFIASLVPTFLVSDLLLLNQFPDVEADRSVGRRSFPVTIGRRGSAMIYGLLLLLVYVAIAAGVAFGLLPAWSLLAIITAIPAWKAYQGARQNAENIPALISSMGLNVIVNLTAPVLLAVGLFIA